MTLALAADAEEEDNGAMPRREGVRGRGGNWASTAGYVPVLVASAMIRLCEFGGGHGIPLTLIEIRVVKQLFSLTNSPSNLRRPAELPHCRFGIAGQVAPIWPVAAPTTSTGVALARNRFRIAAAVTEWTGSEIACG